MFAGAAFAGIARMAAAGPPRPLRIIFLAGTTGALADSALGATLQQRRWCDSCERSTERRVHECGTPTSQSGGLALMTNDTVNLLATLAGGGCCRRSRLPGRPLRTSTTAGANAADVIVVGGGPAARPPRSRSRAPASACSSTGAFPARSRAQNTSKTNRARPGRQEHGANCFSATSALTHLVHMASLFLR